MFFMMNEARIGVGLGAVALGYTGYLRALAYAKERPQGPPRSACGIKPYGNARSSSIPTCVACCSPRRATSKAPSPSRFIARGSSTSSAPGDAGAAREAQALLDLLTPIAKSWPSQWCLAANDLAIQVHGGYGYTRDYDVEQLYRDNRLNAIHEGTHGIQALDLLGRKVTQNGGAASRAFFRTRIAATDRRRAKPRVARPR